MQTLPNQSAPLVGEGGKIVPPWNSYFQQFTQAPPAFIAVTLGASPFEYEAKEPGYVNIQAGTISEVRLYRGGTFITCTGVFFIPVGIGDIVRVTYSVAPTLTFIPLWGNVPG